MAATPASPSRLDAPDRIDEEGIRRYFVHLTRERKLARATVTIARCGIKFFYTKTLKRDPPPRGLRRGSPDADRRARAQAGSAFARGYGGTRKKVPVVLSRAEVDTILTRGQVVRHRACLTLAYCCGLRLQEARWCSRRNPWDASERSSPPTEMPTEHASDRA